MYFKKFSGNIKIKFMALGRYTTIIRKITHKRINDFLKIQFLCFIKCPHQMPDVHG